jgi:hypothetical protein
MRNGSAGTPNERAVSAVEHALKLVKEKGYTRVVVCAGHDRETMVAITQCTTSEAVTVLDDARRLVEAGRR